MSLAGRVAGRGWKPLFCAKSEEPAEAPTEEELQNSPEFLNKKIALLNEQIADIKGVGSGSLSAAEIQLTLAKQDWEERIEKMEKEYTFVRSKFSNAYRDSCEKALAKVVTKVLEVSDNFDRAFQSVQATGAAGEEVERHYKEVHRKLLDVFVDLNVTAIPTVGHEFDYTLHEAITQLPDPEVEEGYVCQEFQKGYAVGGKVIRAALVGVSSG
jgi:molecular chaperone GrpE